MATTPTPVLGRSNYTILIISLLILLLGLYIMTLDTEPYGFGFLGLTLGPVIVVTGLLLPFFSIFPVYQKSFFKASRSKYDKLNTLFGWLVFAVALAVYILTLEPTASFWDCGEFIASAYKLQVPHPLRAILAWPKLLKR